MRILLVNPPNCGRSIPEERFGITSLKRIFRGEPLGLEVLAGNLEGHEVSIVDLKPDPEAWPRALADFAPDVVGFTAMTCEAIRVRAMAQEVKNRSDAWVAVGGVHASMDPGFFNVPFVDFVVRGLGKASFRELVDGLARGETALVVPGVARTSPGRELVLAPRRFAARDLVESAPPRYDLVASYREHYILETLGLNMGFVSTSFGCPQDCSFCCISRLTGGAYLSHDPATVCRDIAALADIPVIRLVDADTFAKPSSALALAKAIRDQGLCKQFLADARADCVVRHPGLFEAWRATGLRALVIGFEEVEDRRLSALGKRGGVETNREAIAILHGMGITVVGDFIVSPDYGDEEFDELERFVSETRIDLPIFSVLTPLPGTSLYNAVKQRILVHDLDYYTLTNAVTRTRLEEERFYGRYARLMETFHRKPIV